MHTRATFARIFPLFLNPYLTNTRDIRSPIEFYIRTIVIQLARNKNCKHQMCGICFN
jgi:hypothetical protein